MQYSRCGAIEWEMEDFDVMKLKRSLLPPRTGASGVYFSAFSVQL